MQTYHPFAGMGAPNLPDHFAAYGTEAGGALMIAFLTRGVNGPLHALGTLVLAPPQWIFEFDNVPPANNLYLSILSSVSPPFLTGPLTVVGVPYSKGDVSALAIKWPIVNPAVQHRKDHLVCYGTTDDPLDVNSFNTFANAYTVVRDGPTKFIIKFTDVNPPYPQLKTLNVSNNANPAGAASVQINVIQ